MNIVAEAIANALTEGLETPPHLTKDHQLPARLYLPGLRTAKFAPPPHADAIIAGVNAISEAIVHLIEKDHKIIATAEYADICEERDALRAEVFALRDELAAPILQVMGEGD